MTLEQEVEHAVKVFRGFGDTMGKDVQRICALGGAYFAASAEAAAPKGTKPHRRYSTAKVNKALRAPKGMGNAVATYMPGNLSRSIRVLELRRAKNSAHVGAKLAKGASPTGTFSGARADGYYMHMVEKGTKRWSGKPFFLAAWDRSKPMVTKLMVAQFEKVANKYIAEHTI